MSDAEDRKEARAVLKRLKDIPKNKLTVTQRANKKEAMGILSGRDTEQETYRPTTRNKKEGGKDMAKAKTHAELTKEPKSHKRKKGPKPPLHSARGRLGSAVIKKRIEEAAKKYPVKKKRHGGMTRVGLSPAEEARAGTMSEDERVKYMAKGSQIKKKKSKSFQEISAADRKRRVQKGKEAGPKRRAKRRATIEKEYQARKKRRGPPESPEELRRQGDVDEYNRKYLSPKQRNQSLWKSLTTGGFPKGKSQRDRDEEQGIVRPKDYGPPRSWMKGGRTVGPVARMRAKGGKVGNKKSQGKRISSKQTDGNKIVASLYD